nr:ATPase, T2SS/T4P/T4SS family [Lacticaseibacillus baoqingensis]
MSLQASDVYLLPQAATYGLFFRLPAGFVHQVAVPPEEATRWINYLKYQAGMNVAEHRRVQLGALRLAQLEVALRLSTVADAQGAETLVARLIYGIPELNAVSAKTVQQLADTLAQPGLLALSGPTGSGKTTLLYQVAKRLAPNKMVMTIEDPVEIVHPEFLQLQVNESAQMGYAALLKAALRHRPDILVIGEIRDGETARSACEAAISGHIVLATVHARSAELVPLRLTALGAGQALVQAALVASAQVRLMLEPQVHAQVHLIRWQHGEVVS